MQLLICGRPLYIFISYFTWGSSILSFFFSFFHIHKCSLQLLPFPSYLQLSFTYLSLLNSGCRRTWQRGPAPWATWRCYKGWPCLCSVASKHPSCLSIVSGVGCRLAITVLVYVDLPFHVCWCLPNFPVTLVTCPTFLPQQLTSSLLPFLFIWMQSYFFLHSVKSLPSLRWLLACLPIKRAQKAEGGYNGILWDEEVCQ